MVIQDKLRTVLLVVFVLTTSACATLPQRIRKDIDKGNLQAAIADSNGVLIVNVPTVRLRDRNVDPVRQSLCFAQFGVASGVGDTAFGPLFKVAKFHSQDRCLKCVEPAVEADFFVGIPAEVAVNSQSAYFSCEFGIVSRDDSTVASGSQILRWEETEAACSPQDPRFAAVVGCSDGLAGIFEDKEVVLKGKSPDRVHVGALAKNVDRHDRSRFRSDRRFDGCRINVVRVRQDVDENGSRPGSTDRSRRRKESERRGDDFVTRADVHSDQRKQQGIRPGRASDGVSRVAVLGDFEFQFGDFVSQDESLILENLLDRSIDCWLDRLKLSFQVDKRDRFGFG